MAEEIIGKVSATDKNPSTINEFYFWTKAGYKLSPFDVIKVDHIEDSVTLYKRFCTQVPKYLKY